MIYAPDVPLSSGGYYWAVGGSNYTEGVCDVPGELSEIRGFIVEGQAVEYQLYLPAVVRD